MANVMCEDLQKAKENRERQAQDNDNKPYYWWEYPDPFPTKATPASKNNSGGLARSRKELQNRGG